MRKGLAADRAVSPVTPGQRVCQVANRGGLQGAPADLKVHQALDVPSSKPVKVSVK